jgi:hypothetical protein
LVIESDKLLEDVILIEVLEKTAKDGLLHILHAGRLHGNHSRSLQRLRNQGNLNGYLGTRFDDVNSFQLAVKPLVRNEMLIRRKNLCEPSGPDGLIELTVSSKPISR